MEDLELSFKKMSLAADSWKDVKLDVLLKELTLNSSSMHTTVPSSGPSLPVEASSRDKKASLSVAVRSGSVDQLAGSTECTAIVPFKEQDLKGRSGQRRWRRIPRIFAVPRPMAKFAVDSDGTAFVLSECVRSELISMEKEDKWKRCFAEENANVTSTAIVIYQKPRKHDLVEDFLTLKL